MRLQKLVLFLVNMDMNITQPINCVKLRLLQQIVIHYCQIQILYGTQIVHIVKHIIEANITQPEQHIIMNLLLPTIVDLNVKKNLFTIHLTVYKILHQQYQKYEHINEQHDIITQIFTINELYQLEQKLKT